MTDQNANKISVQAQVEPGPDTAETLQSAAPAAGSTPAVAGTRPPHLPNSATPTVRELWPPPM